MTYPTIDDYTYSLSPHNNVGWDVSTGGANNAYIYKSNGTTIGGEGPNVQYHFITHAIDYSEAQSGMNIWRNPGGYADPANNAYVGYQRDEVYRFGLVLFNTKGQHSFVKYVGDIRFPRMSNFGFGLSSGNQLYSLGIHFDFNFTDLDSDIVAYQIVRAERTYSTATVVDCGYVGNLYSDSGSTLTFGQADPYLPTTEGLKPGIDPSGVTSYRYLLEYICPETNYNKDNYAPQERLDTYTGTSSSTIKTSNSILYTNSDNAVVTSILPIGLFNSYKIITNSALFAMQPSLTGTQSFEGFTIRTRSTHNNGGVRGYKGSTLLLHLDSDLLPTSGYDNQPHYALRRRTTYPYGGYTEVAVNSTVYYPCSPVTPIGTTGLDVWGGDTYISNFEYMRVLWADATSGMADERYVQVVQALVETKLNLMYTVNEKWSKYDDNTQVTTSLMVTGYEYMGMQETAGVHPFFLNRSTPLYFTQEKNLYTYNPVYSETSGSKEYYPKPTNFTENVSFPTRVYKSNVKINGETTDSWLQFLPNNYKDIDNQFGDLTRLYNHNNTVYFFQKKGFGVIPVNDREVISTSTGSSTVIGTGGVLERFDYVSTNAGTSLPQSIVGTDRVLYFLDDNLKKICSFNNDSLEYMSDSKGLYSYVTNATLTSVYSTYNPKSKEVLFCFPYQTTPETLVFNEYTNSFVGFSSTLFTHGIYNNGSMYVLGTFEDTSRLAEGGYLPGELPVLYTYISGGTLGTGKYGRYTLNYMSSSTTPETSVLDLIVNPARNIPVRLDIMELTTEFLLNGTTNTPSSTFSTLRVRNNYQDTGTVSLTPSTNIIRRFRTWRYNQLRDTLDSTSTGRMIDNYARVTLTFSNDETSKLLVNDVTTTFTPLNLR